MFLAMVVLSAKAWVEVTAVDGLGENHALIVTSRPPSIGTLKGRRSFAVLVRPCRETPNF
jgi:hypothetical protein